MQRYFPAPRNSRDTVFVAIVPSRAVRHRWGASHATRHDKLNNKACIYFNRRSTPPWSRAVWQKDDIKGACDRKCIHTRPPYSRLYTCIDYIGLVVNALSRNSFHLINHLRIMPGSHLRNTWSVTFTGYFMKPNDHGQHRYIRSRVRALEPTLKLQ